MKTAYQQTVAPTLEPIEIADALDHLRVSDAANYPAAERAIRQARAWAERYLRRGLLTQTWKYAQDVWSDEIQLPMAAPLQSVTQVQYYNSGGVLSTLSSSVYLVDALSEPGRLHLAPGQAWPTLQTDRPLAVEVTYVVGWTAVDQVPGDILRGLYLLVGDYYELREQTIVGAPVAAIPQNVVACLEPARVTWTAPGA